MKIFDNLFKNQKGISLPLVIILISGSIGTIGYLAMNLLPRLQDGKKKAEQAIQYRIFMNSLNDYLVHGIRERWCINVISNTSGVVETDFLLSNACANGTPMETVVTYPGNLERILWDAITIGGTPAASLPTPPNGITILGLNDIRRTAGKTTVDLQDADVYLPDNKMQFRITEAVLNDMTNVHPLFTMVQEVKSCIDTVDVVVQQIESTTPVIGDEKKLRVDINVNLKVLSMKCRAHQLVSSTSFYTFYPRRLHNFALIKYKDLDASMNMEFHAPVYLAGNLDLPPSMDPKSMIFYDTLTLATYNGGTADSRYYAGQLMYQGEPYTFTDRGHPYNSKQDSYDTFRGILGGLRLDAVEDKGLYNLFDKNTANNANVDILEACIEENKVKTTPSQSNGSVLAYRSLGFSTSANPAVLRMEVGFTKKNRFKNALTAPAAVGDPPDGPLKKFIMTVPPAPNGVTAVGDLKFNADTNNSFTATMGDNSSVEFKLDLSKYSLDTATIDASVALIVAPTTKATYPDVIPSGNILRNLPEYTVYLDKADDLVDKCDDKPSIAHCQVPLGYVTTCDHTSDPQCDQTSQFNAFVTAENNLKNKLLAIKSDLSAPGHPTMTALLEPVMSSSDLVVNKKVLQISFSQKWKTFYPMVASTFTAPQLEFTGYHYGSSPIQFRLDVLASNTVLLELRNQNNNNSESFYTNWRNSFDNQNIPTGQEPEDIIELECPTGMGLADWDLDMSSSTNFAWNYANVPAGVPADGTSHNNINDDQIFEASNAWLGSYRGTETDLTKSVANKCIIKSNRKYVYGFFVCKELIIKARTEPLYIIGTFIVKELSMESNSQPVYWHSMWTPTARDLVLTELNLPRPVCNTGNLTDKTFKELQQDPVLRTKVEQCSSQELVSNGPNNFSWTTTDPDIGIDPANPTMTSQKVKRYNRWVMREDSRKELIK